MAGAERSLRQRRRHDATPVFAVRLDLPSLCRRFGLGLRFAVDLSDEFGRVLERRILGIDLHHREDRRDRLFERKNVAKFLLDHVTDHAFGFGAKNVERIVLALLIGDFLEGQAGPPADHCRG